MSAATLRLVRFRERMDAEREVAYQFPFGRGMDYDPWAHVHHLQLQVIERAIKKANAYWMPAYQTIVIRSDLAAWAKRQALAHEIGHALHNHKGILDDVVQEFEAERFAAEMMFDHSVYVRTFDDTGGDVFRIARALRMTPKQLNALLTPTRQLTPSEIETGLNAERARRMSNHA